MISKNAEALRFYERHGLLPFTVSFLGRIRSALEQPDHDEHDQRDADAAPR